MSGSGGQLAYRLQTAVHTLVVWAGKLSKADASNEAFRQKVIYSFIVRFAFVYWLFHIELDDIGHAILVWLGRLKVALENVGHMHFVKTSGRSGQFLRAVQRGKLICYISRSTHLWLTASAIEFQSAAVIRLYPLLRCSSRTTRILASMALTLDRPQW